MALTSWITRWRVIWLIGQIMVAFIIALPNFLPSSLKWPHWLPQKTLTLGLDLQGGVDILLEVDAQELLGEQYAKLAVLTRKSLRDKKIRYHGLQHTTQGVSVVLKEKTHIQEAIFQLSTAIKEQGGAYYHSLLITLERDGRLLLTLPHDLLSHTIHRAVDKSIEVIRRRIDETGAVEPLIQSQGTNRIILQIPGFSDPQQVLNILGSTAKLSFQWVTGSAPSPSKSLALPSEDGAMVYQVDPDILLTGEQVLDARVQFIEGGKPVVSFTLNTAGGQIFSELTRQFIGRQLGIILDKKVLSAPMIKAHIASGQGIIEGMNSIEDAQKLALLIRSGALPAPLKVLEQKVLGPGLGQDSIRAGTSATLIAIFSVAAFMILAYSFFGLFAVIGVCLNILFLIAALTIIGATLTLPGIAGIALTVGMAVDANVLINERIKGELAAGKKMLPAIHAGYQRAMSSIVDSNVTTLMGAGILYFMGTGPVKGFAVTMALGILISMFTAVYVTRVLISMWIQLFRPTTLKI